MASSKPAASGGISGIKPKSQPHAALRWVVGPVESLAYFGAVYNLTVLIPPNMLRFVTAGESHGQALVAWISGLPADLPIDMEFIARELHRRQLGYGRGGRQRIEKDRADILAGVR